MGKHRHQPSPSSSSSSDEENLYLSLNESMSSIDEQRKKKSVNTKEKHKESRNEKNSSSRKRETNEEVDRKRSKEYDDGKGRSKTHSSSWNRKESTSTNKGSTKKLEDIQSTSRTEDYDKYKEKSKKDSSSRSHKQLRSLSKEKMEKSLKYDNSEERKKQSKRNKKNYEHLEHSKKEVSSKEKTSKRSKSDDNLRSKEEYIDFDNDQKYEEKKQKRKKSESSADETFPKKLKKHEEKPSEDKMKESHTSSDSKNHKNKDKEYREGEKDKENYKEDEVSKSSKKEKSLDTKPTEKKFSEERDVKIHKRHKRSLSPRVDVSESSKGKDGMSKKAYKNIDADADLDELQMMKEQLQQQLDQEEGKERRSSRQDEHFFEKDYRREEEERRFFNKDRMDSHKNLDSYKDKRSSRHEEGRRLSRNEEDKRSARYEEQDKKAARHEEHVLTESPSSKSRKMKTSDTYWNKYADKLGIKIHDPKDSKNEESSRQLKRSRSPQSSGRKVTSYEDIDNFSKDKMVKENETTQKVVKIPEKVVNKPAIRKPVLDTLSTRTGGAYIPPAKLKMMQDQMTDKTSAAFQRLSWEALKKSLNGLVNKVNVSNIGIIVRELFKENIVRGRGLLCRALMQAQSFSPTFTHVYAAMAAVINTKFPQIGELLLHRLILQLRRGVKRNDKNACMASCRFVGHLVNQQVAHEVVALEILTMLLDKAKDSTSDDSEVALKARHASVELAIAFMKECGMRLTELTPKGVIIIMETLRNILHEGQLEARFKYMIEVLMAVQKENFKDFPAVQEDLDLVEEDSQFTHMVELDGSLETGDMLNVFQLDTDYEANEEKYRQLRSSILADDSDADASGSDSGESGTDSSGEEDEENATKDADGGAILDRTEMNLVAFRRIVYLTIQSSLDVDECAHKLLKGEIKPGWEEELCNMIIDCCAQQRTYIKFYGLLAQRFCQLNRSYQNAFETIFADAFETCHRLEIEKLRNVAKLFAHLMFSDAVGWTVMTSVRLNQDETTSSSRVFLKILFEELANDLGLQKLNARLREPSLSIAFEGLLPRDNPIHTRFAINFFTTIGLGGLTDDLREFLRLQPKPTAVVAPVPQEAQDALSSSSGSSDSSSSSDSDSSSSDSSDSDSSSSSSDSSSDDEDKGSNRRSHNKRRKKPALKKREESEEELVVEKSHKRKKNIEERRPREERNRDDFRDNRRKDIREEEREQRPRDGKKEYLNKRKRSNERESFRPREDYRDQRYLEERDNRRDERSWKSGREEKSRREEREERPRERKEHRSRDRSYEQRKSHSIKGRP